MTSDISLYNKFTFHIKKNLVFVISCVLPRWKILKKVLLKESIAFFFPIEIDYACMFSCVRLCNTMEPTRLLCPWDFPGKNTGVCCHFLLQGIFLTRDGIRISYVSCIGRWVLYHWATWKAQQTLKFASGGYFPPYIGEPDVIKSNLWNFLLFE